MNVYAVKRLLFIFCTAMLMQPLYAVSVSEKRDILTAQERQWLEQHKDQLYFAPDPYYAPFEFYDQIDNTTKGLAHEYIRLIEKKLGVSFIIKRSGSFNDILSLAKEKKVAIVNAAAMTKDRSAYLNFTDPFIEVKNVILVKKNNTDLISIDALKGKKISVVRGYAVTGYLAAAHPEIEYDAVSSDLTAMLNTAYGVTDAAILDLATSTYLADREGITGLRIAGDVGYPVKLAIGTRKDWPELSVILNKALGSITPEERERISHAWINPQRKNILNSRLVRVSAAVFIAALFLFAGIVIVFNRMLKRQVAKKTGHLRKELEGGKESEVVILKTLQEKETLLWELNSTRKYLVNIIESMPSLLITADSEGRITQFNHAAADFTGRDSSDAMGTLLWEIAPDFRKYEAACMDVLTHGRKIVFNRVRLEKYCAEDRYYDITLYPLIANGIGGFVFRADDITEIERKDAQLRQSQKMEIIGTLAGGIAHDFNNVLAGIIGSLSLIRFRADRPEDIPVSDINPHLETIELSAKRAAEMVNHLLNLSHKHEVVFSPSDLNDAVKNVVTICRNSFDKSIEIREYLSHEPAIVLADQTQIEQVLLNVCVNALHSMTTMRESGSPYGGVLSISVSDIVFSPEFCHSHPAALPNQKYWRISVMDTGVGIYKKNISKVFDPFFTTKIKEKGSGLGLSMVYNIVNLHKGFVDVYSEINAGSEFNVYIPVSSGREITVQPKQDKVIKGEGLILVIEDEYVVKALAEDMLRICGYTTFSASNGEEGKNLYKEHKDDIACVLLDLVMPVKNGLETFMELKALNPEIKVIITSGFKQDERVSTALNCGAKGFIQKPYTLESLSTAVSRILTGNS